MSNRNGTTEVRSHRNHSRLGRRGAALLLGVAGLIGLVPTASPATPTFKIRIVDLSLPQANAGEDYMLRTDVVTTCAPLMDGGYGSCETIGITATWWTNPNAVKTLRMRVLPVGGPLQVRIPSLDVQAPTLHYRLVADQVWTRTGCLYYASCPKIQTASTQVSGSAQVS